VLRRSRFAWLNALSESDMYLCIHKYPSTIIKLFRTIYEASSYFDWAKELWKLNAQNVSTVHLIVIQHVR